MEPILRVDPYHFHYTAIGRSNNPPILFLHGFMGNSHEFNQVMTLLADRFYCLAVDLPGHGKTQVIADQAYRIEPTANGLIQFLDALNIQSCHLAGYSMGGRIGLYLTLHFPAYFRQVVLESASPGLKTESERIQRLQQDLNLAQALEADFSTFLSRWYHHPLFASLQTRSDFAEIVQSRLQNDPANLAQSLRQLSTGRQPSLWQKLKQNQVPLLLLVGELDSKFVRINTEMVELCELATLKVIDQCGHNIHLENPDVFAQQIRSFFEANVAQL